MGKKLEQVLVEEENQRADECERACSASSLISEVKSNHKTDRVKPSEWRKWEDLTVEFG